MSFESTPRWVGWVWVGGAAMAIVGSIVGVVIGWALVGAATESIEDTVTVTRRVLISVGETTEVVDAVFDDVAESVRGVQTTVADTSLTLTRASVVTSNLAEVVSEDVPASVDSVRDALPALIDTARVIDRTMRGLSFFGVDYDPDVPLDESLVEIDASLAEIPPLLTSQQETLDGVADDLGVFASSTVTIAEDLAAIRVRLSDASRVLAGYGTIVDDSTVLLDRLETDLRAGADAVRLVLVLIGLGVATTQTLPLLIGWQLVRGREGRS